MEGRHVGNKSISHRLRLHRAHRRCDERRSVRQRCTEALITCVVSLCLSLAWLGKFKLIQLNVLSRSLCQDRLGTNTCRFRQCSESPACMPVTRASNQRFLLMVIPSLSRQMDRFFIRYSTFYTKNGHFAKTGSGQTWAKLKKERLFSSKKARPRNTIRKLSTKNAGKYLQRLDHCTYEHVRVGSARNVPETPFCPDCFLRLTRACLGK